MIEILTNKNKKKGKTFGKKEHSMNSKDTHSDSMITDSPSDVPTYGAVFNEEQAISRAELLEMTTKIITSYLNNNTVDHAKVPALIDEVFKCIESLCNSEPKAMTQAGQIAINKTIQPDYIICLEDGKKLKMLKRHLRTNFKMSPEEYRAKWGLPSDYPMVAPNYAARRSEFAKKIGLGKSTLR